MHKEFLIFTAWLHLHPSFGGWAALLIAFSESIAILGTIVPGSITMTAIGVMMGSGILPIWQTLLFAIIGAIIGDGVSYMAGYYLKEKIMNMWPFKKHPQWLDKGSAFFEHHGGKSVFLGRFIGPIRAMVPLIAGMLRMKPTHYFPVSIFSSICWAPCYLLPGFIIGFASKELPPSTAAKIILAILAIMVLIWLIYWVLKELSILIGQQIDMALTKLWQFFRARKRFRWFCFALESSEDPHHHGQLVLFFASLLTLIALLVIIIFICIDGPKTHVNMIVYNFFRSIRVPSLDKAFTAITILGQVQIYIFGLIALFCYLFFWGYRRLSFHLGFTVVAALGSGFILKYVINEPRPTGITFIKLSPAFPSGHALVASVIYAFIAWMLCIKRPTWRPYVYGASAIILLVIYVSRLYLGAHWFMDVVGSCLWGFFFCLITILAYQRHRVLSPRPWAVGLIMLITTAISYAYYAHGHYRILLENSQIVFREHNLDMEDWWSKRTLVVPAYRANLVGGTAQALNVEWAGSLDQVEQRLVQLHWTVVPEPGTSGSHSTSKLGRFTLFPLLLNAESPTLVVAKQDNILYLWRSHITLTPEDVPLWLGILVQRIPTVHHLFHSHIFLPVPLIHAEKILGLKSTDYSWRIILRNLPAKLKDRQYISPYTLLIRMTPPKNSEGFLSPPTVPLDERTLPIVKSDDDD